MEVYSARVVNGVFWGIDGEFRSVVVLFFMCGGCCKLWGIVCSGGYVSTILVIVIVL